MKSKKVEILVIAIFLIIQSLIYTYVGANKEYLHIDEAYSFGLSNYERINIQDNEDFFNNWHNKEYYEDYLTIQEDEAGNYAQVYENQKNDVHPPLYYLLLRTAMEFAKSNFSKWTGIGVNIIIYAFITILMYLILKKILKNENNFKEKALILAFMSSIILASLSNVVYIRMYSLLTLEILITIYLHIKLLESEKINYKLLLGIGICTLIGVLTHYYYIFYIAFVYLIFFIKYIKEKKIKSLCLYTLTMIISGIISLVIFPYSIQHMFFGYRGQGVISNFENIKEIIPSILGQIYNLNYYGFNNLLPIITISIIAILIYKKVKKKEICKIDKSVKEFLKIIYIPSICFFLITSIASPWRVLRYIVPVCSLIFILVIYYLYKLLQSVFSKKTANVLIILLFGLMLISPFVLKMKPELLYTEKKEIVQELSGKLNLPTIYFFDPQRCQILDDILLFSKIDESYIAKNIDFTQKNIQDLFKDKDTSKGVIILISKSLEKDNIIDMVKDSLYFENYKQIGELNNCEIFFCYNL